MLYVWRGKDQQKYSESANVLSFSLSGDLLLGLFYSLAIGKVLNGLQAFQGPTMFEILNFFSPKLKKTQFYKIELN